MSQAAITSREGEGQVGGGGEGGLAEQETEVSVGVQLPQLLVTWQCHHSTVGEVRPRAVLEQVGVQFIRC